MESDFSVMDMFRWATRLEALLYALGVAAMLTFIFTRANHYAVLHSAAGDRVQYMFGDKAGKWWEVGKPEFLISYYGIYWLLPCLVAALWAARSARQRSVGSD